ISGPAPLANKNRKWPIHTDGRIAKKHKTIAMRAFILCALNPIAAIIIPTRATSGKIKMVSIKNPRDSVDESDNKEGSLLNINTKMVQGKIVIIPIINPIVAFLFFIGCE